MIHDPDDLVIAADNFDAYQQMLMDEEHDFITEEGIEEWE